MYPVGSWLQFLNFLRRGRPSSGRTARTAALLPLAVRGNVIYLGLTSLLTDISSEMVISVLPIYLITILRLTPAQFGIIDGLYQGVAAVVQLVSGVVTDRWRKYKEVAAVGYGLSAVCRVGLLTTGSAAGIASVLVADRLGKGIRTAPRDALLSLSVPREQLGLAFGVHRAMDAAGAMLGPILAFAILAALPGAFDVVFVTSLCVAVVGLAVLGFFVENRNTEREVGAAPVRLASIAQLFRNRTFPRLFVCTLLLNANTVSDAFVYLALQRHLNLGSGSFPLLYVCTSFSYLLLAVPAGRLADRVGRVTVFVSGYGVLVAMYAMLLLLSPSPTLLFMVLITLGAHYAATEGVLMALGSSVLPSPVRSSGLAALTTATAVARFGASALFGVIWNQAGLSTALATFAGGLSVALIVTLTIVPKGVGRE
jgi:MFS family permease